MSPVEFKKTLCRPADFKGQGSQDGKLTGLGAGHRVHCR